MHPGVHGNHAAASESGFDPRPTCGGLVQSKEARSERQRLQRRALAAIGANRAFFAVDDVSEHVHGVAIGGIHIVDQRDVDGERRVLGPRVREKRTV